MKVYKHYIESTFAISEAECRDKLKAISNYPEIKETLNRIDIDEAVRHDHIKGVSLDGYCAYLEETD